MASTNDEQGQWYSVTDWVKAEQIAPKKLGTHIVDFERPVGRVYMLDGRVIENVTRAFILRRTDGTLASGYPVTGDFKL